MKEKRPEVSHATEGSSASESFPEDEQLFATAIGCRVTANDLQDIMNRLTSGGTIQAGAEAKLFGYFLSVAVLRALAAECMLKAIACARTGSFEHQHNLSHLYEALDGAAKGFIERLADSHGVASPKRVLKRHRNDFVEWRYPTGTSRRTDLLDLDRVLEVLDSAYRRFKNGTAS